MKVFIIVSMLSLVAYAPANASDKDRFSHCGHLGRWDGTIHKDTIKKPDWARTSRKTEQKNTSAEEQEKQGGTQSKD